jgi:uncharacterized protein (TIGR03086 family)
MTTGSPRTAVWDGLDLLERAVDYTRGCLTLASSAAPRTATPCAQWDLEALLAHLDDSLRALEAAGRTGFVDLEPRPPATRPASGPETPVDLVRRRACDLLGSWTRASGSTSGVVLVGGRALASQTLMVAGALELAVHGWDLATACGVDRPLPRALAEELLCQARTLVTEADRPARFAAPHPVGPGSTATDRLVAFLGRAPKEGGQPGQAR